ncbi:PilZ domain-containing protein [Thioalkalivibrio sp. ALJ24]|uniref:PilZ domain-containing protein n=1 Tax=Thioalkalivibrio sp. ALJ24 TaxID=545276 RepID=UPI00037BF8FE|nr:PilZ domain-containing protein [Thioalkalivibrio sp. ALJ24]
MSEQDWSDWLGDTLTVRTSLAVGPTNRPVTRGELAERLVDGMELFEAGGGRGHAAHGVADETALELQRLERKLDLLVHLLAEALEPERPTARPVVISRGGMVLPAGTLGDDADRLALYLSDFLPQPLVLGVETPTPRENAQLIRWTPHDDRMHDALGRWIFRLHRRDVAEKRQKVDGGAGSH